MDKITETIQIEGMSCAGSCVRRVSKALENVEGVEIGEVTLGSARVSYDPARTEQGSIARAIEEAGFTPVFQTA